MIDQATYVPTYTYYIHTYLYLLPTHSSTLWTHWTVVNIAFVKPKPINVTRERCRKVTTVITRVIYIGIFKFNSPNLYIRPFEHDTPTNHRIRLILYDSLMDSITHSIVTNPLSHGSKNMHLDFPILFCSHSIFSLFCWQQ